MAGQDIAGFYRIINTELLLIRPTRYTHPVRLPEKPEENGITTGLMLRKNQAGGARPNKSVFGRSMAVRMMGVMVCSCFSGWGGRMRS